MEKVIKPNFKISDPSTKGFVSTITISPLQKAMGNTLGNSLRRVLLESVPGAAVHAVKISGASHEFDTIKGIKEDAAQVILNLKQLAIKFNPELIDEKFSIKLENATGTITAKDIVCPAGVEIINKDLYIATASKGETLSLEGACSVKFGYRLWKDNRGIEMATGFIPVDSNYSPIVRMNYTVDHVATGKELGNEKLTLVIETNGTVEAKEAVAGAARILMGHLELFANIEETLKDQTLFKTQQLPVKDEAVEVSIEDLDLSVRPYNCLKRAGISSLSELVSKTKKEIRDIKNLGQSSYEEIIEKLKEQGFDLM